MTNSQIDREVIHQCLGDGVDGVRQIVANVTSLADTFRQRDVAPGHGGLATLAHDLEALIVLVETLREPMVNLGSEASAKALPSSGDVEQLAGWLESLVAAQAEQDWLTVSDVLEYDIEPALSTWLTQFEAATAALGN